MKKIEKKSKNKKLHRGVGFSSKKATINFRSFALKIIPSKLTGDPFAMRKTMKSAYSAADSSGQIYEIRGKNAELFLLILVAIILSFVVIISNLSSDNSIGDIKRDRYGGETKVIEGEVTAEYNDETLKKRVQLKIRPESADTTAIAKRMSELKFKLPDIVIGDNESFDAVESDLNLIKRDEENGIEISWKSSNESIIDSNGKINLIDAEKGDYVILTAQLRIGEASDELKIPVTIGEPVFGEDLDDKINLSIENLVAKIGENQAGENVKLPETTNGGIKLSWSKPQSSIYYFIPVFLLLFGYFAYKKRYSGIEKKIKEDRESVGRDFPDFLSKLLLLLNAGMVISSALAKIADDYESRKRKGEERYFYEELSEMQSRIRNSNAILSTEFSELALKTGRREVMRFSAILVDNIDKGSSLAEKLTQESEMLWTMRKKTAEEKGRIAETKLTFPMVLQLLVIILITIAPATLEMR